MPKNAPYVGVVVGEPVDVRVFIDAADGMLTAGCSFRGDKFGSKLDLSDLSGVALALEVDKLVAWIGRLVWHELLGTPVFQDDDEEWTARVDAQRPWEAEERSPQNGWIAADERPSLPPVEAERGRDPVLDHLGDANVQDLRLTQDEMAALMRREFPPSLIAKLLAARSTENLLDSAMEALVESSAADDDVLGRALEEIREVRRRFGGQGS